MQGTAKSVTNPGDTSTKIYGRLTVTATITIDGGLSINVFTGPIREANLCFTFPDLGIARRVYAVIGEGGNNGVSPEGIHQAVTDALTDDLRAAERRRDGNRIELLNDALDRLDTPLQITADEAMLTSIAETIRTGRPTRPAHALSGWGQIKANHAGDLAKDRANRTAQPALFGTEAAR